MKDHFNLMGYFPRSLYEIKLKSMKSLMSRTEIQISPDVRIFRLSYNGRMRSLAIYDAKNFRRL
jgi:hypothetical protein